MVLIKNFIIFYHFISEKTGEDNAFRDFLERKKRLFRPLNQEVKKDEKLGFSLKKVVHGFDQKIEIFLSLYLC